MNKYRAACAEYAKWNREVRRLTKKINGALMDCPGAWGEAHLKAAYQTISGEDLWGRESVRFANHEGDVEVYLSAVCPACLAAHKAIEDRRKARKQFANAKRRISLFGRAG